MQQEPRSTQPLQDGPPAAEGAGLAALAGKYMTLWLGHEVHFGRRKQGRKVVFLIDIAEVLSGAHVAALRHAAAS